MDEHALNRLQARIDGLAAKEEIRDVLYRYCRGADRLDAALMKSCYHPDAHDDHGFYIGPAWEFVDFVIKILAELELSIHALSNPLIEVDGDRAFCETQWSVIHRLKRGGKLTDIWDQGRYLDEFERRDGQWKIINRVVVVDAERWSETFDFFKLARKNMPQAYLGARGAEDPAHDLRALSRERRPAYRYPELWNHYRRLLDVPLSVLRWFAK